MTPTTHPHLTLILVLLLVPSSLYAWGREGHEIVAIIAEQRLEPGVRQNAATLLEGTAFIGLASWDDQVRNEQTALWHYVNIAIADTEYDAMQVCPQNQRVIAQIERFRKTLADHAANFKKPQKALTYLIHFVGDLHQPFHAGDNHDRGGNDVQVEFLGQTINPYSRKPWNLHAVWDSAIVEQQDRDTRHYVERLTAWLNSQPEGTVHDGSVLDWAMESHRIAKDHVYVLPGYHKLGEDCDRANGPVVDQQFAKAGVRLARLLNEALGKM